MNYKKPIVIAEVGCNHMGDFELAKEFIKRAVIYCNVDVIKFQKRNVRELLTKEQYYTPHPNPSNSFGKTYGEHREFLEFTKEQHQVLKNICEEFGVTYSSSVWDLTSAKEIAYLKPNLIKIPSACNNNMEILNWLCDNYEGEIHVSLGMTSKEEEENIISIFKEKNREKDLVLYACTSGYPVPPEDLYLLEVKRLNEDLGDQIGAIGFSNHSSGLGMDLVAYTLGATYFERHFTLDRTWKGTDHAASLEPEGLRRTVRDLNNAYKALKYKEQQILEIEKPQRDKLKYRG